MKKEVITILSLFIVAINFAQQKYSNEFSFINDNDLYISTYKDRYYTNGMFLSYRYLSKKDFGKLEKRVYEFQLGQHMYTPFKATVEQHGDHDRPFAAYLYGSFGVNRFYKNNDILKTSIQIGVIGKNAFGRELQDFIHDIYKFKKAVGWKYQIADAFVVNFNADYIKQLAIDKSNHYDINWINKAHIGTAFTDISTGLYSRIGFKPLQKLTNSIAFGGNLNNESTKSNNEIEVFLYANPMIHYTLYDATIQGSFLNTSSPITFSVIPFKFTFETGIRFTLNRFNLGYAVHYHTKKLKSIRVPQGNFYATIQLNYQFN